MKKILVTGGTGRFASELFKKYKNNKNYIFLSKQKLNILSSKSIKKSNEI